MLDLEFWVQSKRKEWSEMLNIKGSLNLCLAYPFMGNQLSEY